MASPPCDHLLIGVCGSIHATQLPTYLLAIRQEFASSIRVIMTSGAQRMIPAAVVELYADDRVIADAWDRSAGVDKAAHIQLTRWADLFLILPATANILGKAAHGIADDALSTAIVSSPRPVVFAPAMNPVMWASKAVQRNVAALRADGHTVLPPEPAVSVTSGEWDEGLAPSPAGLLPHLWHLHLKSLQQGYWEEATAHPPLTPAQKRIRELAGAAEERNGQAQEGNDEP